MATVFSVFRVVVAITTAWFLALLVATGLVFGILGHVVTFWVHTTLMGALAFLSGPLLLREIRTTAPDTGSRASGRLRSFSTRSFLPCSYFSTPWRTCTSPSEQRAWSNQASRCNALTIDYACL